MLSFTGGLKVFVALEPCDLRKSFNGLEGLVRERLQEDLKAGALFVFTDRSHNRLKTQRARIKLRSGAQSNVGVACVTIRSRIDCG
jgi:transposase